MCRLLRACALWYSITSRARVESLASWGVNDAIGIAIVRQGKAGVAEQADAGDLKSPARKGVRVRAPPPAPFQTGI